MKQRAPKGCVATGVKVEGITMVADCHEDVLIALEKMLEDAGFNTTNCMGSKGSVEVGGFPGLRSRADERIPAGCGMRGFAEGVA
jgi:hypothetical protein